MRSEAVSLSLDSVQKPGEGGHSGKEWGGERNCSRVRLILVEVSLSLGLPQVPPGGWSRSMSSTQAATASRFAISQP